MPVTVRCKRVKDRSVVRSKVRFRVLEIGEPLSEITQAHYLIV